MASALQLRSDALASKRYRILVVEDEVFIRCMVSDELQDAGFEVIEACNADEAVEVLNTHVPVDLVISDIRMPGSMDGLGLLDMVKTYFPALPVIIISGHLDPELAMMRGAAQFLSKPFMCATVIEAVQTELETRA